MTVFCIAEKRTIHDISHCPEYLSISPKSRLLLMHLAVCRGVYSMFSTSETSL